MTIIGHSWPDDHCVPLLGLEAGDLEKTALDNGARDVQFFGDYHSAPYNRSVGPEGKDSDSQGTTHRE